MIEKGRRKISNEKSQKEPVVRRDPYSVYAFDWQTCD